ncbi:ABC transporter permease [Peribacillus simplex]|uniref:ABC transporter permease n=1 Tax=Peribacillus simplex TaxID=1478 RepID=UPI003D2B2D88
MGNLLKSELFKLKKDRSFRTLTLILAAVAVLFPLFSVFSEGSELVKVNELYMNIIGKNNYVLKLIPCLLAGYFISSEYSIGTMKSIASSGNSRVRIYFAKLMVFTLGAIIISVIFPIVMTGASAVYFQFNGMPDLSYFVQTLSFIMLYAAAFASIMAVFSTLFTDSGKTIGLLLSIFLLFDAIMYMLSTKLTFLEPIYNYSIFQLLYGIVNINALNRMEVFQLALIPILTYLTFGFLGIFVFQKKEIK